MALTPIQIVRLNVQDNNVGFYFLSDDEIEYLLTKYDDNLDQASIEAARIILMQLSVRGDNTVDIFSIKGSKAAESYRLALQMYLRDPMLNPILKNTGAYFGNVSVSDMQANDADLDNNTIKSPSKANPYSIDGFFSS